MKTSSDFHPHIKSDFLFFAAMSLFFLNLIFLGLPPGAFAGDTAVLSLWLMPVSGSDTELFIRKEIELFREQRPDIEIKVTVVEWLSAWDKIMIAIETGEGPDIIQLGTTWVPSVASMNSLTDLSEKIKEIGGKEAFFPATWESCLIEGQNGVWAVPWYVDMTLLFYRKDMFRKAGLAEKDIADWMSFEKACQKIKKAHIWNNGRIAEPLGIPGKEDWVLIHNMAGWIWGSGGDFLSPDRKKSALQEPEASRAVFFLTDLAAQGCLSRESLRSDIVDVQKGFLEGRYAMIFGGPWIISSIRKTTSLSEDNYGISLFPRGPSGQFSFLGGSNLAVFRSSKHKDEAWDFIRFLCSYPSQIRFFQETRNFPALRQAAESHLLKNDEKYMVCLKGYSCARTFPSLPSWGAIESVLIRQISILWDHVLGIYGTCSHEDIQKELDLTASQINDVLKASSEDAPP